MFINFILAKKGEIYLRVFIIRNLSISRGGHGCFISVLFEYSFTRGGMKRGVENLHSNAKNGRSNGSIYTLACMVTKNK